MLRNEPLAKTELAAFQAISKTYFVEGQLTRALADATFNLHESEFFIIIGPSGCGKSTLLKIIAGFEDKTGGEITWRRPPGIAVIFQQYALFPFLTVYENIAFGLRMQQRPDAEVQKIVTELIAELHLVGFEHKHPRELSGGMKQRVGIARSLAVSPNLLLMDEPFSALDEFTAEKLRLLLLELWERRKMTILMITHSIREAIQMGDRIAIMTPRPGKIIDIVHNHLPRPRNERSPEYFELEDRLLGMLVQEKF